MIEHPTLKPGGGGWGGEVDEAPTVVGGQQIETPPTIPADDLGAEGWPQQTGPGGGGEQTWPGAPTPVRGPGVSPVPRPGQVAAAHTMLISERPTPVFAWLAVMDGPDRGKVHTLQPGTTMIGRQTDGNHIVIADDACSAQHARIRLEPTEEGEDEVFVLYDMASSNGIFVGDKRTYQDAESRIYRHELRDGDYVLIGETTLVFKQIE